MITQRILGFLLLAAGLAIIFGTLFLSYQIFTGVSPAPELFSPTQTEREGSLPLLPGSLQDLQRQLPDLLGEQLQGLLPADVIPQMLNFAIWSMLAGLFLFGGSLVAGIGVRLLKG
ncbi:hypothetical protein IH982_03050 [Patescibacteria group bacterium]|nr:hypothetical protein [Patescibacteria group bacterium]